MATKENEKKTAAKSTKKTTTKSTKTAAAKKNASKQEEVISAAVEAEATEIKAPVDVAEVTNVTTDKPESVSDIPVSEDIEKDNESKKTAKKTTKSTKTGKKSTKTKEMVVEDSVVVLDEIERVETATSSNEDLRVEKARKKTIKSSKSSSKKSTSFDKENFDIDQIGEAEEAYIREKRRVHLSNDFADQYKNDDYVPSLLLPDAPTDYDYYVKERALYTQSAISQGTSQLILSGIIIGSDTTTNGIPYVIVKTDSVLTSQFKLKELDIKHLISVRIPASALMFETERIKHSKDTAEAGERKLKKELDDRLFSRIYYVAENFQEELKLCWCSRIAAMLELQKRAFYPTNDRPALLQVGSVTHARVIAVGLNKVTVEVDGVDCVLTRQNLSWLSLKPNLKDEFHVNDVFMVKILSVGLKERPFVFRGKNQQVLDVKVSKTAAEKDPANEYYNYYINNPKATGVITSEITADGVYVRLADMIDVLCDVSIDEPIVGAECKVKLLRSEQRADKNHGGQMRWYLKGIVKEVLPPRNQKDYV